MNEASAQEFLAGLPRSRQVWFLACLSHELTIASRDICASSDDQENLVLLQNVNEVQHRLTGLIASALDNSPNEFPASFVATMFFGNRPNKHVAAILASAFERQAASSSHSYRAAV